MATIPKKEEASSKERLEKLLQLAVSSSLRATVDSFKTDEDEDMELVAKDVSSSVRKRGSKRSSYIRRAKKASRRSKGWARRS